MWRFDWLRRLRRPDSPGRSNRRTRSANRSWRVESLERRRLLNATSLLDPGVVDPGADQSEQVQVDEFSGTVDATSHSFLQSDTDATLRDDFLTGLLTGRSATSSSGDETTSPQVSSPADATTSSDQTMSAAEVLFVDSRVDDLQSLVEGTRAGIEVVVLDADRDGLEQIAAYLDGRTDLAAVHVVSHGDSGELLLGRSVVTNENLAEYADAFAAIGNALTTDGDLLFYGCNLAEGPRGTAFVDAVATMTSADVAASTDLTGATFLGGDWDLEATTGTINVGLAFVNETLSNYADILDATFTLNVAGNLTLDNFSEAVAGAEDLEIGESGVGPTASYQFILAEGGWTAGGGVGDGLVTISTTTNANDTITVLKANTLTTTVNDNAGTGIDVDVNFNGVTFTANTTTLTLTGVGNVADGGTANTFRIISWSSDQAVNMTGPVAINGASVVSTTGGGNVSFGSTVNGATSLQVTTTGTASFAGAVGGGTALTSLTVNNAAQIDLANVSTTGAQSYTGTNIDLNGTAYKSDDGNITFTGIVDLDAGAATTIDSDADIDGTDGDIRFTSSVRGAEELTVDADTGRADFDGAVGTGTALKSLLVNAGIIDIDAGVTTANGNIDLNGGAVTLDGAVSTGAGAGNFTSDGTTFTSGATGSINTGTGTVDITHSAGVSVGGAITTNNTQVDLDGVGVALGASVDAGNATINVGAGTGAITRSAGSLTTTGTTNLTADAGIGATGAVETTAQTVTYNNANVGGANANVNLSLTAGAPTVSGLNAGSGSTTISSNGSVTSVTIGNSDIRSNGGAVTFALNRADANLISAANADIVTTNGGAAGAAVDLGADNLQLGGNITAGTGLVTLRPLSAAQGIQVGNGAVDDATTLGITDGELDNISTSGGVFIGHAALDGNITVVGAADQATGATITGGSFTLRTDGTITVNAALSNAIGTSLISDEANIVFGAAGSVTAAGQTVTLTATAGAIQGNVAATNVTATTVNLNADDGIGSLTTTASNVVFTNASTGNVQITDTNGATFAGTNSASAGTIVLTTTTGNLATDNITSTNGAITLTAAAADAEVAVNATRTVNSGNGTLTVNADRIDVAGNLTTAAADIVIAPVTNGESIGIGAGAVGDLNLTAAEIGRLTTSGTITIGDAAAGTGTVDVNAVTFADRLTIVGGSIAVTGLNVGTGNTVTLNARTGAITDGGDATDDIVALSAELIAQTGIGNGNALDTRITNLAFANAANQTNITNAGQLLIASVGGTAASNSVGGGTISAGSPLTVNVAVTMGADFTLEALGGGGVGTDDLTINANVTHTAGGTINLRAGDDVVHNAGTIGATGGTIVITADTEGDGTGGVMQATVVAKAIGSAAGNDTLRVVSGQAVDLTNANATNRVASLSGSVAVLNQSFAYTDTNGFDVDNQDLTTNGGAITLTAQNGGTIAILDDLADAAAITSSGGAVTLVADDLDIQNALMHKGTITAGAGLVTLRPNANGTAISIGAGAAAGLAITNTELDQITTSGGVTIGGAAPYAGNITVVGTANQADGTPTITAGTFLVQTSGAGTITFSGTGDLTNDIATTFQTGGGNIIFAGGSVTTTNDTITFNGPVRLDANATTISSGGGAGDVLFNGTINADDSTASDRALTVNAGTGTVQFTGLIGNAANGQLADLDVTAALTRFAAGTVHIDDDDAGAVTATITGAVQLDGDAVIDLDKTANDNSLTITGAVNADAAGANDRTLTVTAGTGTATFGSTIGTGANGALADLDVTAATTNLGGNVTVNDGAAAEVLITGNLVLTDNVVVNLDGTNDHSLRVTGTTTSQTTETNTLQITAGTTGDATLTGAVGVGAMFELGTITINSARNVTFGSTVGATSLVQTTGTGTTQTNGTVTTTSNVTGVSLTTTNIDLNAGITSNGGAVVLQAANSIDLAAGQTITTTGDLAEETSGAVDIDVTAAGNVNLVGSIVTTGLGNPAGNASNAGAVTIDTFDGTIAVGAITTSGGTSTGGGGNGGNAAAVNITSGDDDNNATHDLTLNGTITASAGAPAGGGTTGTGGTVTLVADGAIVDGNAGTSNVTALALVATASTGIGSGDQLETAVTNVTFNNTTNQTNISNTGALTVVGVSSFGSGGGVLSAGSPLTVDMNVTSGGDFVLEADGDGGTSTLDDLTINANVTHTGLAVVAKSIMLRADDDVRFQSGLVSFQNTNAGDVLTVQADSAAVPNPDANVVGDVDFAGGTVDVGMGTVNFSTNIAAGGGAILGNGGAAATDVTAATATFTASTGIGATNAIETNVANLSANNFTANNVVITETDAVVLTTTFRNQAGNLSLTAAGTITDAVGTDSRSTGTATFNAGGNAITLGDNVTDNANFTGGVSFTGADVITIGIRNLAVGATNTLNGAAGITSLSLTIGELELGGSQIISDAADVDIATGATLDFQGNAETIDGLTGGGTVTSGVAGAVTLTVGSANTVGGANFAGVIQNGTGVVALTKIGSGTQTLSGLLNTYTGTTTITAGTLTVDGVIDSGNASANTVEVADGATLAGSGTVNNAVNLAAGPNGGGTVSPGTGGVATLMIETVTFGASATNPQDANFAVDIAGIAAGTFDVLTVKGGVDLNGLSAVATDEGADLVLNVANLGAIGPAAVSYVILANDGNDAVSGRFQGLQEGAQISADFGNTGRSAFITYAGGDGNDVAIIISGNSSVDANAVTQIRRVGDNLEVRTAANEAGLAAAIPVIVPIAATPLLTVTGDIGGSNDNLLIVDLDQFAETAGVNFTGTIEFNAGALGNDFLQIRDTNHGLSGGDDDDFDTVLYTFTGAKAGTIQFDPDSAIGGGTIGAFTVDYGDVDNAIIQRLDVANLILDYNTANNAIAITDTANANQVTASTGGTAQSVTFSGFDVSQVDATAAALGPTTSLTILAGAGNDSVTVDDTVNADGTTDNIRSALFIDGEAGTDTINFNDNITLGNAANVGNLTLRAETVNLANGGASITIDTDGSDNDTDGGSVTIQGDDEAAPATAAVELFNSVTIDTEQDNAGVDADSAGAVSLEFTNIAANAAGFDLTVNANANAADAVNQNGAAVALGRFSNQGANVFVNDVTINRIGKGTGTNGTVTLNGDIRLDANVGDTGDFVVNGAGNVVLSPNATQVATASTITIDTEQGNNANAGFVALRDATISGDAVNVALDVNTSFEGVLQANRVGGFVRLNAFDNAGGRFVNDVAIDTRGTDGGSTLGAANNGVVLLADNTTNTDATIQLDDDTADAADFVVEGGTGTGIVDVRVTNNLVIDTQNEAAGNAGNVLFGNGNTNTRLSGGTANGDLTIRTSTTSTPGNVTLDEVNSTGGGNFLRSVVVNALDTDTPAGPHGTVILNGDILVDATAGTAAVTIDGRLRLADLAAGGTRTIDTDQTAGGTGGTASLAANGGEVSSAIDGINLVVNTADTTAGGNVALGPVNATGGNFLNDLTVTTTGATNGSLTLHGDVLLDAFAGDAADFTMTSPGDVIISNTLRVDTENGGDEAAGSVRLGNANPATQNLSTSNIFADAAGFALSIDTTSAAGNGNAAFGLVDNNAGAASFLESLTVNAGTNGIVTLNGDIRTDDDGAGAASTGVDIAGSIRLTGSRTIDTAQTGGQAGGAIRLAATAGSVSSTAAGRDLVLDTRAADATAANQAGDVTLRTFDAAGGAVVDDLVILAAGNAGGTVNLNGTIQLDAADGRLAVDAFGSIVDGNGAANNLVALEAAFRTNGAVGTAADPFETQIAILEAATGTGVFVAETGDLVIGGIGAPAVPPTVNTILGLSATAGDIVVTATGMMNVNEAVAANGQATLRSTGNLTTTVGGTVQATTGDVTLRSDAGTLTVGGAVNAIAGNAALTGDTVVTTATVNANGNATLVADTAGLTVGAAVTAGNAASLKAATSLTTTAAVTATNGNATLEAVAGALTVGGTVSSTNANADLRGATVTTTAAVTAGVDASVRSTGGGIALGALVRGTRDVTVQSNAALTTNAAAAVRATNRNAVLSGTTVATAAEVSAGNDATLTATAGAMTVGGNVTATNNATITAATNLETTAAVATTNGNANLSANGGNLVVGGTVSSTNANADLRGVTVATTAAVTAGVDASVRSTGGGIALGALVRGTRDVTVQSNAALTTNAAAAVRATNRNAVLSGTTVATAAEVSAGNDATLIATAGAMTVGGNVTATNNASLTAATNLETTAAVAATNGNANLTTNGGNLVVGGTVSSTNANADLRGVTVATTAAVTAGVDASVRSTGGGIALGALVRGTRDVTVQSNAALTTNAAAAVRATNRNAVLSGTTVATAAEVSAGNDATLTATAGAMTVGGNVTATNNATITAATNLETTAAVATTNGNANLTANGGAMTLRGTLASTNADALLRGRTVSIENTIAAGSDVGVTANGGSLMVGAAVVAGDSATFLAATSLTTGPGAGIVASNGDARLTANGGPLTIAGGVSSTNAATHLSGTGVATTALVSAGTDVVVSSTAGNANLGGRIVAGVDARLASTGGDLNIAGSMSVGRSATLTSTDDIGITSGVNVLAGTATITATNDVRISAPFIVGNAANTTGRFTLTSTLGNVAVSSLVHVANDAPGSLVVDAPAGLFALLGELRTGTGTTIVLSAPPVVDIVSVVQDTLLGTFTVQVRVGVPGETNLITQVSFDPALNPVLSGRIASQTTAGTIPGGSVLSFVFTVTTDDLNARPNPSGPIGFLAFNAVESLNLANRSIQIVDSIGDRTQASVVSTPLTPLPVTAPISARLLEDIVAGTTDVAVAAPTIAEASTTIVQQTTTLDTVGGAESAEEGEAYFELRIVLPDGTTKTVTTRDGQPLRLPESILEPANLRRLFANLPNDTYRIVLVGEGPERTVLEQTLDQGQPVDPNAAGEDDDVDPTVDPAGAAIDQPHDRGDGELSALDTEWLASASMGPVALALLAGGAGSRHQWQRDVEAAHASEATVRVHGTRGLRRRRIETSDRTVRAGLRRLRLAARLGRSNDPLGK